MREHTTGPWEVCEYDKRTEGWDIEAPQRELYIATTYGVADESETKANSHLIAAAPDLLSALSDILEGYQDVLTVDLAVKAAQAIAKANGVPT